MRQLGLVNPRIWKHERARWIDAAPPGPGDGPGPEPVPGPRSRLVVAPDERLFDNGGQVQRNAARVMVARGLISLTGEPDEPRTWRALLPGLHPGQVIGLKLNTVAVHLVPHRTVIDALVASLGEAGVRPADIVIWDNLGRLGRVRQWFYGDVNRPEGAYYQGMERAGFAPDAQAAPRILCNVPAPPGVGYDQSVRAEIPSCGLRLPVTRILTRVCDHVINVPVPKDHRVTGITCALKNFYGAVPLWDAFRPTYADRLHANRGDPQVAELYANSAIRGKVRLHVCGALEAICDGGPWGKPQLQPCSLLFATDPVAIDAYVLALIDAARRERGLASVAGRARYIGSAARLGLGTNNPASIEIIDGNGGSISWPS